MIFSARNVVFLLSIAAFVFAEEPSKDKPTGTPSSTSPVTITTPSVASTNSTPPPTTPPTSAPTKPPTPEPTKPPTPEPTKPPTPPPTTPTTTPEPTKPPTPAPTPAPTKPPTPAPTPAPHKNENWIVNGTNGTVCIVAKMVIKIDVDYKSAENKSVTSTFSVDKVENATASGLCTDPAAESLVLKWKNVSATFNFHLNTSTKTYSLDSVSISIDVNNQTFPNNTMNVTQIELTHMGQLFSVSTNNSYSCANEKPLALNGTIPSTNTTLKGTLSITGVKVQAFGTGKTEQYRTAMDCYSEETPDFVPIVVGLVLAGLVVVVLVAYLVGRKRAQSRGYLSM